MIKLEHANYELLPQTEIGSLAKAEPRQGALMRISWPDGKTGHADCFPWPELGDPDIAAQLWSLGQGKITPLMEQTMWLARRDAEWRAAKKSPYKGLTKVKNHYLIADYKKVTDEEIYQAKSAGFTTFKIKFGKNVEDEARWLDKFIKVFSVMVRIDFNAKINFPLLERFTSILSVPAKARIEFVEDPFAWNQELWTEAARLLPLAADAVLSDIDFAQIGEKPPFGVVIIKPARQDVAKMTALVDRFGLKMVVTSSLDHPVGEMHAAIIAGELKKKYPNRLLDCGCYPSKVYKLIDFGAAITKRGPFVEDVAGTGIGFDDLFENTRWKPVTMK